MNGIDAVILATGNDFRAIEAGAHAYAARTGRYKSLSDAWITGDTFHFALELPLALGTVGGLTNLHPLVKIKFYLHRKSLLRFYVRSHIPWDAALGKLRINLSVPSASAFPPLATVYLLIPDK